MNKGVHPGELVSTIADLCEDSLNIQEAFEIEGGGFEYRREVHGGYIVCVFLAGESE